tara:strand:- start:1825 stop:2040 length:216 start_codon:yes stop_codon:yes gene_type:complete
MTLLAEQIQSVSDDTKRKYMQNIWSMDKEQIFHELMRVHAESAKLMSAAQMELDRLQAIINELDDASDLRH